MIFHSIETTNRKDITAKATKGYRNRDRSRSQNIKAIYTCLQHCKILKRIPVRRVEH